LIDQIIALQIGTLAKVAERLHGNDLSDDEKAAIKEIIAQIPTRTDYRLFEQLEAVIQMLIASPKGLSILLGRTPPPTTEQIGEMIMAFSSTSCDLGVRVDGGLVIPQAERLIYTEQSFNAIIAEVGGWKHINAVAKGYMKLYPNAWAIVMNHTRWVRTKISRIDGSSLKKVADAYQCSVETVRNTINSFPRELARAILASPVDDDFDLRALEDYPAV
jgi:hypothetical protein